MKPKIGVTSSARGGWRSFLMHRLALWRAGAKAVRLVAGRDIEAGELDGLVIGGGDDIGAEFYGGAMLPDVRIDPDRDELEFELLGAALPTQMPILGICRGAQAINIALGGTLHTDIHEVYEEAPRMRTVLPRKRVMILEGSRLHEILEGSPCRVNALHHQSIDKLGEGLKVVGRDQVGIVQAIEGVAERFLVGVQWHPELLFYAKSQQRLFRALVESARARMQGETVFAEGAPGIDCPPYEGRVTEPSRRQREGLPRFKLGLGIGAFVVLAAAAFVFRNEISLPTEDEIKALLDSIGLWGPIAIVGLRCLAAVLAVVPSSVVVIAAGAAFGPMLGTVYALIGAVLGAAIGFLVGRRLGREFVEERGWIDTLRRTKVGSWLLSKDASQNRLMLSILYCRLLPGLNLDGVSYVAGITPLTLWRFLLGSLGGLLPYTLLLTVFGHGLIEMNPGQIAAALGALAALAALPFVWKSIAQRNKRKGEGAPVEPGPRYPPS